MEKELTQKDPFIIKNSKKEDIVTEQTEEDSYA